MESSLLKRLRRWWWQ